MRLKNTQPTQLVILTSSLPAPIPPTYHWQLKWSDLTATNVYVCVHVVGVG